MKFFFIFVSIAFATSLIGFSNYTAYALEEETEDKDEYEDGLMDKYREMVASLSTESPKKQIKMGILTPDIKCGDGLEMVLKRANAFPACVKSSSADILIQRGWALPEDQAQKILETVSESSERIIEERNEILEEHQEKARMD